MSSVEPYLYPVVAPTTAAWPERVLALGARWVARRRSEEGKQDLEEMWLLIQGALMMYLRRQQGPGARLDPVELEDIASAKSLELLQRFLSGQWDPTSHHPSQLCAFIATLARNGLIDHGRLRARQARPRDPQDLLEFPQDTASSGSPASAVECRRFVEALTDCADRLSPRARRIWFFRVFYDMPSKQIAGHPDVGMAASAVDVMLARCRRKLSDCMKRKGYDTAEAPVGAFTVLWNGLREQVGKVV